MPVDFSQQLMPYSQLTIRQKSYRCEISSGSLFNHDIIFCFLCCCAVSNVGRITSLFLNEATRELRMKKKTSLWRLLVGFVIYRSSFLCSPREQLFQKVNLRTQSRKLYLIKHHNIVNAEYIYSFDFYVCWKKYNSFNQILQELFTSMVLFIPCIHSPSAGGEKSSMH